MEDMFFSLVLGMEFLYSIIKGSLVFVVSDLMLVLLNDWI